jgi:hypothetical protein
MNLTEIAISFSCIAIQALLLVILLRNRLHQRFKWFSSFLVTNIIVSIGVFVFRNFPKEYLIFYWSGDAIVTLVVFMAIHETFRFVFLRFYALSWFRWIFPACSVALVLIGSLRAFSNTQSKLGLLAAEIVSLEIAAGIVQVGLFCLFLVLAKFFHLAWKQYTFGIALGFGVSAAGDLVAFMVRSEFGTKFDPIFRFVVPLTYTIGVAIWLLTFLWPVPKAQLEATTPALTPEAVVTELKQYTRTVKEILKR